MKRSPVTRSKPMQKKGPTVRTYTCVDCGREGQRRAATGILPKRCIACNRRRENERKSASLERRGLPNRFEQMKRNQPLRARNVKRRPASLATAQRNLVMERDGYTCAFEVWVPGVECMEIAPIWTRCGSREILQTCHVVRRRLCGDAVYSADVVIAGCKRCHDTFDHRTRAATWDSVRVPEAAVARAVAAIKAVEASRAERGLAVVPLRGETS